MDNANIYSIISMVLAVISIICTIIIFILNIKFQKEIKRDKYDKIINEFIFSVEELRFYATILWIYGNDYKQLDEFTEYVNKYLWKLETDFERLKKFKEFKKYSDNTDKLKSQLSAAINIISNDQFECKRFDANRDKANKIKQELTILLQYIDEIH